MFTESWARTMTRSPPFLTVPDDGFEEDDPQAASSGAAEKAPMPRALNCSIRRRLIAGTRRPAGIAEADGFDASALWSDMLLLGGSCGRSRQSHSVAPG